MPVPAADPVCSSLQASIAPAVAVPAVLEAPAFALSTAAPYVPWIAQAQPVPHAEAVMAAVRPSAAKAPLAPIRQAAAMALPAIPSVAQGPFAAALRPPVASPAPAAVESVLVASLAAPMAPAAGLRLLPFTLAASRERTLPGFDGQRLTPAAGKPDAAGPRLVAPHPIATLAVTPPANARRPLESALPHPGPLSMEFHSHRLRSAAVARPEWRTPRPALRRPSFLLRPILEKLEEPAQRQKTARKRPGCVEPSTTSAAKRPPTVWMVAGTVAAGFLLAASLWFGVGNFRADRRLAASAEASSGDAALSAANSASSASMSNGGTPAQPAPKGPVAWIRQTIANRASLKMAEDFRGMENWDGADKTHPAGWSRHPDGYVNTGALALFRPSLKFTDYRMEFFGQIETQSIGWTVHATDAMNYHAMKLTVVEAGMRPFVALVHYNVVGGKSGRRTETPLTVMVHNDRPMQVAVDVRGHRVVTSIDGEEVEAYIDNTLVAGGVGFFSEAGERARLYWMKVSRNDDWLGHVCALLAEGAGVGSTAGLRGGELPGAPADRDKSLPERLRKNGLQTELAGESACPTFARKRLDAGGAGTFACEPHFFTASDGRGLVCSVAILTEPRPSGSDSCRKARFSKTWRKEPWNT